MMRDARYDRSNGRDDSRFNERPRVSDYEPSYGRGHERFGRRDSVRHADLVKVIEVLAESEHGFEDAIQNALAEASRTIRNIKSIHVKDMQAVVRDGRIVSYRLNAKISFGLDHRDDGR